MNRVALRVVRAGRARPAAASLALAFVILLLGVSPWRNAHAASATDNLAVSATVVQKCIVSATAVSFGSYDPVVSNASAALTATGSLALTCTKSSTGVTIALGLGSNASGSTRRMNNGSNYLTYELYQPSATTPSASCTFPGSTVWGTTSPNLFTPSGTTWGAASPQTFNVCGSIAGGQDAAVGSYSDTIIATINF